jgi:hypothetical protein
VVVNSRKEKRRESMRERERGGGGERSERCASDVLDSDKNRQETRSKSILYEAASTSFDSR